MGMRWKERGCLLGDQCGRRSWKARGGRASEPGWGYPKYGSMWYITKPSERPGQAYLALPEAELKQKEPLGASPNPDATIAACKTSEPPASVKPASVRPG